MRPAARRGLLSSLVAIACGSGVHDPASAGAVDDFGDTVPTTLVARRIVSLNPSTTEILFAIGAGDRLVGRTHWDTYPPAAVAVPDLGDGIRPNVESILAAHPDLVLLYASSDNRVVATRLRGFGIATVSIKIDHFADFRRTTHLLGRLLGDSAAATVVVDSVDRTLDRVRTATAALPRPTVFWALWESPLMAVGGGSYLDSLVTIAGGRNIYGDQPRPSPVVSLEDVLRRHPDVLFVSPSVVDRYRADPRWTSRILVPDTNLTGHPAVRLGEAAVSLAALLHPGAVHSLPPARR